MTGGSKWPNRVNCTAKYYCSLPRRDVSGQLRGDEGGVRPGKDPGTKMDITRLDDAKEMDVLLHGRH